MIKKGKISAIMGAVVDIKFEDGNLPEIYKNTPYIIESKIKIKEGDCYLFKFNNFYQRIESIRYFSNYYNNL